MEIKEISVYLLLSKILLLFRICYITKTFKERIHMKSGVGWVGILRTSQLSCCQCGPTAKKKVFLTPWTYWTSVWAFSYFCLSSIFSTTCYSIRDMASFPGLLPSSLVVDRGGKVYTPCVVFSHSIICVHRRLNKAARDFIDISHIYTAVVYLLSTWNSQPTPSTHHQGVCVTLLWICYLPLVMCLTSRLS